MHPELCGTGHYFRVMRSDSSQLDGRAVLASAPVSGVGAGSTDGTVALPRLPLAARFNLSRPRVALHPLAGPIALLTLIVGALAVVVFATSGPTSLVPRSGQVFPQWEAGPLHGLFGSLPNNSKGLGIGFSIVLAVMLVAYFVALAAVRTLSMKMIVLCVVALHAILLLSPPLMLTDLFNYLGYARLGGLHHLNPYTHVIAQEIHDPIYRFATWYHLHSPYGPLFTAASYPVAWLPLGLAYWTLKLAAVLGSLIFIALVWKCAKLLGRDPRFAVLFVAANPVYLMYAIAGFHNDFFMLIPSTAAIALLLARRDRSAGAMVMVAVAVKFTAILLLPFLLVAARPSQRRKRVMVGAVLRLDSARGAGPGAVRAVTAQPEGSEHVVDAVQRAEPDRHAARGRRWHPGTLAPRHRCPRGDGGAGATTPRGLADRRRLVNAGADREPRLARALVRHLAASAGGAGHQHAHCDARRRSPRCTSPSRSCQRPEYCSGPPHQPHGRQRGQGVSHPPEEARALALDAIAGSVG